MTAQRRLGRAGSNCCSRLFLVVTVSCQWWQQPGGQAFTLSAGRGSSSTLNLATRWSSAENKSGGGGSDRRGKVRSRGGGYGWRVTVGMNAADTAAAEEVASVGTATKDVQAHHEPVSNPVSASEELPTELEAASDDETGTSTAGSGPEPRMLGDLEEEGFSGTRPGFQVLKEYDVPEEAPTNLPEGEEHGYPMLLYQFMHAQYRDEFPSQSSARKSVRRKELLLNGAEVRNDVKVNPGDTVTMQKRARPGLFPQGKPTCELPVVWEDDFVAVVVKPPGVAVHGGTGEEDPGPGGRRSVRQALPYMLKPTESTDRPLHRPLHCHRLDKSTGGLLICAKTRPALSGLSDAFEKRLVSKRYVALVAGELEGSGAIVSPLDGKTCHTNYRVRGPPVRSLKTPIITTVDLWPITGRHHQLRRHLASLGCPILGDRRYTPDGVPFQEGGMYLHAVGLTFPHPITGEELDFAIPEPAKFEKWRQKEEQRWLQHHGGDYSAVEEAAQEVEKIGFNEMPEVDGLQVEERDGFRYFQYDWSVVGGPPTALSTDDIDTALDGAP